jgi:hypothetical protein
MRDLLLKNNVENDILNSVYLNKISDFGVLCKVQKPTIIDVFKKILESHH